MEDIPRVMKRNESQSLDVMPEKTGISSGLVFATLVPSEPAAEFGHSFVSSEGVLGPSGAFIVRE